MEQVANQLQNVQNQLSAAQVEVGRLRYECVGKVSSGPHSSEFVVSDSG